MHLGDDSGVVDAPRLRFLPKEYGTFRYYRGDPMSGIRG